MRIIHGLKQVNHLGMALMGTLLDLALIIKQHWQIVASPIMVSFMKNTISRFMTGLVNYLLLAIHFKFSLFLSIEKKWKAYTVETNCRIIKD